MKRTQKVEKAFWVLFKISLYQHIKISSTYLTGKEGIEHMRSLLMRYFFETTCKLLVINKMQVVSFFLICTECEFVQNDVAKCGK